MPKITVLAKSLECLSHCVFLQLALMQPAVDLTGLGERLGSFLKSFPQAQSLILELLVPPKSSDAEVDAASEAWLRRFLEAGGR